MKAKKKTVMLASFALGALLFATTALADIVSKSGYDQLKDSLKLTAENCTEKYDSYTLDTSYAMKDNDKTILSNNQVEKHDRTKGASESVTEGVNFDGRKFRSYSYTDKTTFIRNSSDNENYYVTELTNSNDINQGPNNPFKEKQAEDVEKIADALVGSLKDHVVVTQNAEGSKELSGSLTEVQIPSLVNAVASFMIKQEFGGNREQMPSLSQDIYIKSVTGKASINKEGVLQNLLGTVVLSGKDSKGQVHELTLEFLSKMTEINSTKVAKPDLTGKTVVKEVATKYGPEMTNPEKYMGKFKNDIVIEKDGKFVKIGERIVEITRIDNKSVAGTYHEEYKKGYENYATNSNEFKFDTTFNNPMNAAIEYATKSGGTGHGDISFDQTTAKIFLNIFDSKNIGTANYDPMFTPVLE